MTATAFRHERPRDVAHAVALLAEAGEGARVLSGGTWVVPEMVSGERRPDCVIDLRALGLEPVRTEPGVVVLAATATYTDVLRSPVVAEAAPLLARMAAGVTGGVQVLNLATPAGSACQALPSSDAPGCLAALGARFRIVSGAGEREVAAEGFFVGAWRTALAPDELLLEIRIPARSGAAHGYVKLKHSDGSWPIATAACQVEPDGAIRLALGGVAPAPIAVTAPAGTGAGALVATAMQRLTEPWSDVLADADYRRRVAPVAARRALAQAGVTET